MVLWKKGAWTGAIIGAIVGLIAVAILLTKEDAVPSQAIISLLFLLLDSVVLGFSLGSFAGWFKDRSNMPLWIKISSILTIMPVIFCLIAFAITDGLGALSFIGYIIFGPIPLFVVSCIIAWIITVIKKSNGTQA